jgi:hypothetical protein
MKVNWNERLPLGQPVELLCTHWGCDAGPHILMRHF